MIPRPEVEVTVTFDIGQGHADLADPAVSSMLQEIRSRTASIEIKSTNPHVVLMGGPGELGLVIAAIGLAAFVKQFAELLADDAHDLIRNGINRLRMQRDDKQGVLRFGSLDFHIQGDPSNVDVAVRLRAASRIVSQAPDFALDGPPTNLSGPALEAGMIAGFTWDDDRGIWVPDPYLAESLKTGRDPR